MPEDYKTVLVGIRAMHLRLTVIGFTLAMVSFQMARLGSTADGLRVPGIGRAVHVAADMELYMALALSVMALLALIMSCEIDEAGICTHWSLMAGDLLMYMALAHAVAGIFAPLATTIETLGGELPHKASEINILESGAVVVGGAAWFLATYVGPLVSLLRSPFDRRTNFVLGIAYLLVLLVFCWLTDQSARVESAVSGDEPGLIFSVLRELVQPLRW